MLDLPKETLAEFQQIFLKEKGVLLEGEELQEIASRHLELMSIVFKPIVKGKEVLLWHEIKPHQTNNKEV